MKGILAGSVLLLTIIGQVPAHAQNPGLVAPVTAAPPVATGFIWAGPYIGVYGGYGFGQSQATGTTGDPFDEGGITGLTLRLNPQGAFGGVTVGYNQQTGNVVWGVEGEAGYLGLRAAANPAPGFTDDAGTVAYGFYATLAARFGIAMDRTLLFARAGGIIAQYIGTYGDYDGGVPDTFDQTTLGGPQFGYVIGAGAEFAFDANWTAKLEYNFLNLGTDTTTNNAGDTYTHRNQAHLIKFGLNFLFGN